MSCIVAVEKDGDVSVAWDSGSYAQGLRCVNAVSPAKVVPAGENLIGSAGLTVVCNLLHAFVATETPPLLNSDVAVLEYFVSFWRAMRERYHFVDDRWESSSPCPFADLDCEFVVANKQGLYRVKEILSVSQFEGFCAVGSGAPLAETANFLSTPVITTFPDLYSKSTFFLMSSA